MPNIPETITAFLATSSLGAIWSVVGQDYSARAVADRFAQLEPVLLFAADGSVFNGARRDRTAAVHELRAALPTVRHLIGVSHLGETIEGVPAVVPDDLPSGRPRGRPTRRSPTRCGCSSRPGRPGCPKGIIHTHGGVLLEQLKMMGLHLDLTEADRFTWYTSPSWVV